MYRSRLLIFAFLSLMAFALLVFVFRPLHAKVSLLRDSIKATRDDLEAARKRVEALNKAEQQVGKYEAEFSKLERMIPAGDQRQNMLASIDILARENKIDIKSVGMQGVPRRAKQDSVLKNISINIDGRGTYASIKDFIHALEKQARIIDVADVRMLPEEPGSPMMQFSLAFDIYYQ